MAVLNNNLFPRNSGYLIHHTASPFGWHIISTANSNVSNNNNTLTTGFSRSTGFLILSERLRGRIMVY